MQTRRLWVYVCLILLRDIFEHTHTQTDNWEKTRELSQGNLTALPYSLTVLLSWDWQAACRARLASNHNKRTKKSKKSLKNQEFQKKFDNVLKSLCISIRKEDLQSSHDIGFEEPEFGQVSVSLFKCTTKYPLYLRKLQPINFLLVSTTYLPLFCFIFWCTKAIEMLWPYFTSLLLLTFHFLNIPHFSK